MPQTKKQEIVYTVMMVCVMVYGMVCYNIALDVGGMQNFIFAAALSELPIMGVIGFLLDTFLVGPAAMRIAMGWFTPGKDKQVFLVAAISCLSAWMMCPLMSFFATLFFKDSHNANFFAMWVPDHGDELSRRVPVAAVRRRPAGAVCVRQRAGRHEKAVRSISQNIDRKNTTHFCTNKTAQKPLAIFGHSAIITAEPEKVGLPIYIIGTTSGCRECKGRETLIGSGKAPKE